MLTDRSFAYSKYGAREKGKCRNCSIRRPGNTSLCLCHSSRASLCYGAHFNSCRAFILSLAQCEQTTHTHTQEIEENQGQRRLLTFPLSPYLLYGKLVALNKVSFLKLIGYQKYKLTVSYTVVLFVLPLYIFLHPTKTKTNAAFICNFD